MHITSYWFLFVLTIGKSWVYRYIFKDVFPILYGSQTVQRNRLALSDEDASEYKTFEAISSLVSDYRKSKVMLCTFMLSGNISKNTYDQHCLNRA